MIKDCLSIIELFKCEVAFKIILQKINLYYTYFILDIELSIRN